MRGPNSRINSGDTVKIMTAGWQVPQWAVGLEGVVDRINREGGLIVEVGYKYPKKFVTAKPSQAILVKGKNFKADHDPKWTLK